MLFALVVTVLMSVGDLAVGAAHGPAA